MDNTIYHIPALAEESMEALAINPDGVYVDLTFGGGGHKRAAGATVIAKDAAEAEHLVLKAISTLIKF